MAGGLYGSMLTAGPQALITFHYIAGGRGGGFLPIDENNRVRYYPPQYLAAQVITKEWVSRGCRSQALQVAAT
jgi:hypothetical protein